MTRKDACHKAIDKNTKQVGLPMFKLLKDQGLGLSSVALLDGRAEGGAPSDTIQGVTP